MCMRWEGMMASRPCRVWNVSTLISTSGHMYRRWASGGPATASASSTGASTSSVSWGEAGSVWMREWVDERVTVTEWGSEWVRVKMAASTRCGKSPVWFEQKKGRESEELWGAGGSRWLKGVMTDTGKGIVSDLNRGSLLLLEAKWEELRKWHPSLPS